MHPDALGSFHTMKDVKELKLSENLVPQEEYGDAPRGYYVCPITGLETDGKHKFVFSWRCGCVVSERAIKEVDMEAKYLVCQKPLHRADLVIINPTKKELDENSARLVIRKMRKKGFSKNNDKQEYSSSQESASSTAKETDDGWDTKEVNNPGGGRGRRTRTDRNSSSQESTSTSKTKKHKS